MTRRIVTALLSLTACIDEPDELATTEASQPAFVHVGNIAQGGTVVNFEKLTNVTGIDVQKIVGITACDPKSLYAAVVHINPSPYLISYPLYFSGDSGQTWTALAGTKAKSPEIACDHGYLATLDDQERFWTAQLNMNGTVGTWTVHLDNVLVDRIQGGDGSFYGVKLAGSHFDVYRMSTRSVDNTNLDWGSPIASIGAPIVTGTGTTRTGTDNLAVGNTLAWPRRAFALEANGTISTNSKLLDGINSWTWLNTGSERYTELTAAAPNVLFGLQVVGGVKNLARIRIEETSCADGIDNDSNGLKDGEDNNGSPSCRQVTASTFCSTRPNGTYCADRFQPSVFLDQNNRNTALITCTNHVATIAPGMCQRNLNTLITNQDYLVPVDQLAVSDPPNTGRYCNMHWPDGSWDFAWTGTDPCATLLANKPNGTIVRAGLYSTTNANHVFVRCDNGGYGPLGAAGVAPLVDAHDAVGKTTNRCIFQVSAGALPLFDRLFDATHEISGRGVNGFMHSRTPVPLEQFGWGETGMGIIDRFGKQGGFEYAYDNPLDEGRPLYAAANGVVIANGSRDRDVRIFGSPGTPYQGEVFVQHSIGTHPTYRETFVVYYAHLRKRIVEPGQTVRAGQIIGYVGASGATGGFAHLHVGFARLSNTNAHTPNASAGYRVNFQANNDSTGVNTGGWNSIDPLGWANSYAFDPWAYADWDTASGYGFTGIGAWSLDLFKAGKQFRYPSIP
jgi:murein DD-endopeptidase MepM/ murein hydrolase activator NlpD